MATPFEFVTRELRAHLLTARLAPAPDQPTQLYHSAADEAADFSRLTQAYPGGYPFYYPAQLTRPGRAPPRLRLAGGGGYLDTFTRPDGPVRPYLDHYGYWRIEGRPDPAHTDCWVLLLLLAGQLPRVLVLPAARLQQLLACTHNPEKFSLLLAKAGFCFAGQPLTTASRLAVLQHPALLDTPDYAGLRLDSFLDNWQPLAAP